MNVLDVYDAAELDVACRVPTTHGPVDGVISVLAGVVEDLPAGLEALVLTSDLQAREAAPGNRSMGVVMAEELAGWLARREVDAAAVGVVLAGDFYTKPDLAQRFGVGDVSDVWDAFAARFRWVTGVLGNVDRLPARARKRHRLLEGTSIVVDSLRIAGVSGIIGDARLENRRHEAEFLDDLNRVLGQDPDLVVLHEGPAAGLERPGNERVRAALRDYRGLVVCGHQRWPSRLARLRGAAVVNTDSYCVVLSRRARQGGRERPRRRSSQ